MKNLIKASMAVITVLVLAGCATTGAIVAPPPHPTLAPPSATAMAGCLLPINLPPGNMTQKEIEHYWGLDRAHQLDCLRRHKILADYINKRDAGLAGISK